MRGEDADASKMHYVKRIIMIKIGGDFELNAAIFHGNGTKRATLTHLSRMVW